MKMIDALREIAQTADTITPWCRDVARLALDGNDGALEAERDALKIRAQQHYNEAATAYDLRNAAEARALAAEAALATANKEIERLKSIGAEILSAAITNGTLP